ncbi:TRAP transporter 4TM/12TM fusion protein [Constrictibacter sp. MBR-5]|jgi:TRAP transporter 4TM/12TM fusion protein|uniref:TRAP transporter permease n=1 Tax=Constrictibacter sp. MBR-5 TaxID=3156467 RepID=UPI0033971093
MAEPTAKAAVVAGGYESEGYGQGDPHRLTGVAYWVVLVLGAAGILININQVFNLQVFGLLLIDTSYFYVLVAIFLSLSLLIFPAWRGAATNVPWYDWLLAAAAFGATMWLAWHGGQIIQEGWDIIAPTEGVVAAAVLCILGLEAVRRCGGLPLFIICGFFFLYPLFAEQMPGFLWGPSSPIEEVFTSHALGSESIIGVPMRTVASLLLGFLIFGSALVVTGGGDFFMAFATALMGKSRGGPAKVAILSSGFFGSLSGSVISNVVTTGQLTIPTMKRIGYPSVYAASVEACASTGGALMPPVMGAVAFIMAEFLNVPYSTIMLAALVPALLFYLALLLQVDNYAARHGLKGQPASEIPDLWQVLKGGWYYLFSLVLLVYMLLAMRIESYAPYFATAVLLVTCALRPTNRFGLAAMLELIVDSTKNIANIVGILVGIGMIVGALSYTGVGGAFSRELLQFAGGNIYLLLIFGAITSFILGMGMTASACYIFLAIVLGPALIGGGLDPIASHLFILYWGMLSFITPPVALAAVAAASIAKANALATGFKSMRMGAINFILPFLFVLNPTLILQGDPIDVAHDVTTAVFAVWLIASGFEGWLYGVGRLDPVKRILLLAGALVLLIPGTWSDLGGAAIVGVVYLWGYAARRAAA